MPRRHKSWMVAATTAIALCFRGFRGVALVLQPIVGSTVMLALMMYFGEWRPSFTMHWPSVRSLLGFSGHVLSSSMITYATRNVDQLLIGRFIGQGPWAYIRLHIKSCLPASACLVCYRSGIVSNGFQIRGDADRFFSVSGCRWSHRVHYIPLMAGLFAVADDLSLSCSGINGSEWSLFLRFSHGWE